MTVLNIRLDKAYLIGIWLETLLYGINASLFFSYLFIARYKRKTPQINKVILFTAISMFCCSTVHVSIGLYRLIGAFINHREDPGGVDANLLNVSLPANVAKVLIHTVNSILGDGIIVWRCYHVWGKRWSICVVPILLIVASAVCGIGQGVVHVQAATRELSVFGPVMERWSGSVFILSLCTNVVVTTLIAFRIWYLSRQTKLHLATSMIKYQQVLSIVVESGMIYSSALVIVITFYFLNTNATCIIYDPITQVAGIVPTMIIVMSSLGLTSGDLNSRSNSKNRPSSQAIYISRSVTMDHSQGLNMPSKETGHFHRYGGDF